MPFDSAPQSPIPSEIADKLAKMDKVIRLLSREDRWCKQQLRSFDGRRCILGAMMVADGTAVLRDPVLRAIHEVQGRDYGHHLGDWPRIECFNDHPTTTHADVLKVLHRARDNIAVSAYVKAEG